MIRLLIDRLKKKIKNNNSLTNNENKLRKILTQSSLLVLITKLEKIPP